MVVIHSAEHLGRSLRKASKPKTRLKLKLRAVCVFQKTAISSTKMARPGGLELPTFWFVAIRAKMLNALFGVAYELEAPFFPQ
jgi:hypothetical protein